MQITETAAERMRTAVLDEIGEQGKCFRIAMTEDRADLVVDEHRSGDITFEYEGTLLLVVDEVAADAIGELVLDFDSDRSELVFRREDEYEEIVDMDTDIDEEGQEE